MERLTRKLERKRTSLADLCQLYRASSKLPQICAALSGHDGPHAELLRTKCGFMLVSERCVPNWGGCSGILFELGVCCPKLTVGPESQSGNCSPKLV